MLMYVHDETLLPEIVARLRFGRQSHELTDLHIVIARLFEHLEHVDNAIHTKLLHGTEKIPDWKESYFSNTIFSDPLIQWRYASFMYSKQEYDNALQETKVGIAVYDQLEDWKRKGVPIGFPVPDRVLYVRRGVEYELCSEVAKLKFRPVAIAGVMELCNCILSKFEDWNGRLEMVATHTGQLAEQSRCICFQILFRLCALSAGGLKGPALGILRDEFKKRFHNIDVALGRKGENDVKNRTWWLLATSVMKDGTSQKQALSLFQQRIDTVTHHPPERKIFEKACATLISLWSSDESEIGNRNEFAVNALNLLREQTEWIVKSAAISQSAVEQSVTLTNVLAEALRELKEKGRIESGETIRKKIAGLVGDAVEHIVVDTAVAGLRSVLGI